MLLMPIDRSEHYNFLENAVTELCTQSETVVVAILFTYDEPCCLLSDRGYNYYSLGDNKDTWEFNINSKAFIRFWFAGIEELLGYELSNEQLQYAKKIKHDITLYPQHNDYAALSNYNKTTVYQSAHSVFSSTDVVAGL